MAAIRAAFALILGASILGGCHKENPASYCSLARYGGTVRTLIDDVAEQSIRLGAESSLPPDQKNIIHEAEKIVRGQMLFGNNTISMSQYDPDTGNITCELQSYYLMPRVYDRAEAERLAAGMRQGTIQLGDDVLDEKGHLFLHFKLSDDPQEPKGNKKNVSIGGEGEVASFAVFRILLEAERLSAERAKSSKTSALQFHFG